MNRKQEAVDGASALSLFPDRFRGEDSTVRMARKLNELFPGFEIKLNEIKAEEETQAENGEVHEEVLPIWNELEDILKQEVRKLGKKPEARETKQKKKGFYIDLIKKLNERADQRGFSQSEINCIWKLASHKCNFLTCTQIKSLLFAMVPSKDKLTSKLINPIVRWLEDAAINFGPSVIAAVYQILILYAEFNLVEQDSLVNVDVLTRILRARTENSVIPWKMNLFQKICTPVVLHQIHVREMNKLLKKQDIKKTQTEDVMKCLEYSKLAREDLFSKELSVQAKSRVARSLKLPENVRVRFSSCGVAQIMTQKTGQHPLADRIFPEFLPTVYKTGHFMVKTTLEYLVELLSTDKGICKLSRMPPESGMMQVFQSWLREIIYYRFDGTCGINSSEDLERYTFIFNTCSVLCRAQRRGLPEIREWLGDVLCVWDFLLFRDFIYEMIPYLLPSDIFPEYNDSLRSKFTDQFLYSNDDRLEIWDALTSLFNNWIDIFEGCTNEIEKAKLMEGMSWLYAVFEDFVAGVLLTAEDNQPEQSDPMLLYKITLFYKTMQTNEKIHSKPELNILKKMFGGIPPGFAAIVVLSRSDEIVNLTNGFLYGRPDSSESCHPTIQSNAVGVTAMMTGAIKQEMQLQLPQTLLGEEETADVQLLGEEDTFFTNSMPLIIQNLHLIAMHYNENALD